MHFVRWSMLPVMGIDECGGERSGEGINKNLLKILPKALLSWTKDRLVLTAQGKNEIFENTGSQWERTGQVGSVMGLGRQIRYSMSP